MALCCVFLLNISYLYTVFSMEIINSTENIEYLQFSKTLPNDL